MWRNDVTLIQPRQPVSALAVVQFGDSIGAAKAVARIGLAIATADRVETFAVLSRNAKPGNGHAHASLGCTLADGGLTPQSLVAQRGGPAGPANGDCARSTLQHRHGDTGDQECEDQIPDAKHSCRGRRGVVVQAGGQLTSMDAWELASRFITLCVHRPPKGIATGGLRLASWPCSCPHTGAPVFAWSGD
jgi:hypothetical protein